LGAELVLGSVQARALLAPVRRKSSRTQRGIEQKFKNNNKLCYFNQCFDNELAGKPLGSRESRLLQEKGSDVMRYKSRAGFRQRI
jgi:hypothetical protein